MTKNWVRKEELDMNEIDPAYMIPSDWRMYPGNHRIVHEVEEEDGKGMPFWHAHHDHLFEFLNMRFADRVVQINSNKMPEEIPIRLKWFTPVKGPLPEGLEEMWKNAYPNGFDASKGEAAPRLLSLDMVKLHMKEHPGCPWNGKTILSELR